MFITWKCLWSQMQICYSSWLAWKWLWKLVRFLGLLLLEMVSVFLAGFCTVWKLLPGKSSQLFSLWIIHPASIHSTHTFLLKPPVFPLLNAFFFFFCNLTSFPHIDALFLLYCMLFKCHYAIGCFESTVCVAPLHLDAVLVQNMHFTIMADLSPKSIFSSDRPRKRLTGHFTPVCLKQLSWVYQFMLAC